MAKFDGRQSITFAVIAKFSFEINASQSAESIRIEDLLHHPILWVNEKTPVVGPGDIII